MQVMTWILDVVGVCLVVVIQVHGELELVQLDQGIHLQHLAMGEGKQIRQTRRYGPLHGPSSRSC